MSAWIDHVEKWKDCQLCPLGQQRFRICIARGNVPADVLFVGQSPGASEDARGRVFDGLAGSLMDQIIERSLPHQDHDKYEITDGDKYGSSSIQGCRRCHKAGTDLFRPCFPLVSYALTNLVCCFPRDAKAEGNEEPARDEILACRPRLVEFVNIVQPRLIVCVGALAAEYVDHADTVECVDLMHPAAILKRDMPLAQKNMAAQKLVVVLRGAVEKMLASERRPFTKWGEKYANRKSQTSRERIRADYDNWVSSRDDPTIPF